MKYNTEIVFSDRKTVSISVSPENKITVRCPKNINAAKIERFLEEKSRWIENVIAKNNKKLEKFSDTISFKSVLVNGKKYPLYTGSKLRVINSDGVWISTLKDIEKVYLNTFSEDFLLRVKEISEITGLNYGNVKIKNFKARWGSCDSHNNLQFNYKIFMLPEKIRQYVIIHELSHTAQHNHSNKFWRLVEEFMPDYKQVRRELKNYNFITTLY